MQLTHILSFICLLFYSAFSWAYAPLNALPEGNRASLLVENLDSKTLLSTQNNDQYFPPASTLKVVTALAAKLELSPDFSFETRLEQSGKNWVIRFSGDPTLSTNDLKKMLSSARDKGLNKINGDIWLDNSTFTGYNRAIGWPWDILGVCYSAPSTAITLDGNCVHASIYTQKEGKTRVYVPEHFPIYASTQVKSVTKSEQESSQCGLELISSPDNHYQLNGCLVERKKPLPLKFAVQDPELYTQRMVHSVLRQLGIKLQGKIRIGSPSHGNTKLLASHHSEPLNVLLEDMLKRSDNLIADNLAKTLGRTFFHQPGSFNNGTAAIKQIIFAHTGINLEALPLVDGSGLSRNNRFSSKAMADILHYIWRNDDKLNLIALLPVAGESGTLKYRQSMRKEPVVGTIIGKSGSLYGSYNMAGYGLDASGKPNSVFVQFVTDYFPPKRKAGEKPTVAPITKFETLFYNDVVKFSQAASQKHLGQ
ncbi:serine-type D-Ala-D-Ala carboxypeptidase [Vibrio japonicus]|uniref:Serine-type D-Ala-D-Ala carboxypeptidase n=1 Tax=Vibrio japonicus TaxID=1824638 RepID=A0ABY5LFE3_9VIBR|nr:serine-type D-Ala-D-Ala carboxypeptidase [Vibrio japonicus]UUM30161.1 serine-type D-Ala-D-Ala carboxypeptidase [Vibrio japonicus]